MGFFKGALTSISPGLSKTLGVTTGGIMGGGSGMGDKLKGAFGIASNTGQIDPSLANITPEEQQYQQYLLEQQRGNANSIAQQQLMMGQQAAFNQVQALAASNRSVNPALAQRQAQMANSNLQAQTNQQAGLMRAEEQAQATAQLGDFYNNLRQSRLGLASNNAQASANVAANRAGLTKQVLSGAGQAGAAAISDENMKENIESGDKEIKSFLDAIKAYKYDYKNESDGKGEFVSPMAQDLEKSKAGAKMVKDTPKGKMVEYDGHSLGTMLAAQGYMNKKIENMEAKLENILKAKNKKG